jgi:hypothetical protein
MCEFKSAWYLESGELVHSISTDGHEHLALARGINDGMVGADRAVRVEFAPPYDQDRIFNVENWILKLDEYTAPSWWNKKKEDCLRQMMALIKNVLITEDKHCLLDGQWIIAKDVKVDHIFGGKIISAVGADLSGVDLRTTQLNGADLSGANLNHVNMRMCNLEYAKFNGADLSWANLYNAYLINADLSNANLNDAYCYEANMHNCNLQGANLSGAIIGKADLNFACRLPNDKPIPGWRKDRYNQLRPYNPGKKKR